jgi:SAM-dependent methyltransferase
MAEAAPGVDQARRFYEDFSLAAGLRDWLVPNPRHEQLKLHVDELLGRRRGLRIADIGCGAGVMTAHLSRFGDVTGLDFSRSAIEAARRLVPDATFIAGTLESLPGDDRFDVIALFDVLEHIPSADRPTFLAGVRNRLVEAGTVVISTPFPAFTHHRRAHGDETLQIVDEEVELPQLAAEAAAVGLQLLRFEAFDIFRGSPEYQILVFTTERSPGGPAALRSVRLQRRLRLVASSPGRRLRRLRHAARLAARGKVGAARWLLTGRPPRVRS